MTTLNNKIILIYYGKLSIKNNTHGYS